MGGNELHKSQHQDYFQQKIRIFFWSSILIPGTLNTSPLRPSSGTRKKEISFPISFPSLQPVGDFKYHKRRSRRLCAEECNFVGTRIILKFFPGRINSGTSGRTVRVIAQTEMRKILRKCSALRCFTPCDVLPCPEPVTAPDDARTPEGRFRSTLSDIKRELNFESVNGIASVKCDCRVIKGKEKHWEGSLITSRKFWHVKSCIRVTWLLSGA